MSLEDAAVKVKISKKSLDDYLMQLRSAKKFDFDFDSHKSEKVGVIRKFVKTMKDEERKRTIQKDGNVSKKGRKMTCKSKSSMTASLTETVLEETKETTV